MASIPEVDQFDQQDEQSRGGEQHTFDRADVNKECNGQQHGGEADLLTECAFLAPRYDDAVAEMTQGEEAAHEAAAFVPS